MVINVVRKTMGIATVAREKELHFRSKVRDFFFIRLKRRKTCKMCVFDSFFFCGWVGFSLYENV
jgi:hypothetical protein